jgi:LmbE family N-acetylglucosaminyl deacetylase
MSCIVSFHAHPDDEALFTGGTLARWAAEGHRVVLVTATAGAQGLSDVGPGDDLARTRIAELHRSADVLGCARVVCLDYPDSGWSTAAEYEPAVGSFATVPFDTVADRLAAILREEHADVLTTYDARGGYGHLDHVRVHDVGAAAAQLAGTPLVLQATIDRTQIQRGLRVLQLLRIVPPGTATDRAGSWFSGRAEITHRVNVRAYARQKKAALAAHRSQAAGGDGPRTARILLALPRPLFALVCGTEWFVESGAVPTDPPLSDPLAGRTAVRA